MDAKDGMAWRRMHHDDDKMHWPTGYITKIAII